MWNPLKYLGPRRLGMTGRGCRRRGLTLTEMMIASAVSAMVAIGLASLTTTATRMARAIYYQQLALREGKAAMEFINQEIRQATTPLRVLDAAGNTAVQGNAVVFSRAGESAGKREIQLVSTDGDLMTPWDNSLVLDPDTGAAGDEIALARWLTPLDAAGAFSYQGATTALEVRLRAGDPETDNADLIARSNAHSGPGIQGLEVNIAVAPRN
ncbi:MAG: prepilin-type N-terminal cleavage/methylation domain-containing protein [bacterium]|nr:prepilin-type N-terminal cleavage/methylation domain-containing protein [bacterium]